MSITFGNFEIVVKDLDKDNEVSYRTIVFNYDPEELEHTKEDVLNVILSSLDEDGYIILPL